ncbi:MAG TPA: gamma-glutamyltransferase, partial [Flavisolibacter sp.]|nr:gamma-glutamyltransferase [Flavisolibacter sp.]
MKRFIYLLPALMLVQCHTSRKSLKDQAIDPFAYTITKKVVAAKGAVVSAHPLASAIGIAVMKEGGNAFDAAIATQLALAVVYPNAGNIGGGGFLVANLPDSKSLALDYREMAPSAA